MITTVMIMIITIIILITLILILLILMIIIMIPLVIIVIMTIVIMITIIILMIIIIIQVVVTIIIIIKESPRTVTPSTPPSATSKLKATNVISTIIQILPKYTIGKQYTLKQTMNTLHNINDNKQQTNSQ